AGREKGGPAAEGHPFPGDARHGSGHSQCGKSDADQPFGGPQRRPAGGPSRGDPGTAVDPGRERDGRPGHSRNPVAQTGRSPRRTSLGRKRCDPVRDFAPVGSGRFSASILARALPRSPSGTVPVGGSSPGRRGRPAGGGGPTQGMRGKRGSHRPGKGGGDRSSRFSLGTLWPRLPGTARRLAGGRGGNIG